MPVIYCLIARGKLPLAEYSRASGNFTKIAHQLLNKIPSYNTKMTYDCCVCVCVFVCGVWVYGCEGGGWRACIV